MVEVVGGPLRLAASQLIKLIRPIGEPALYAYARISPEADRKRLTLSVVQPLYLTKEQR